MDKWLKKPPANNPHVEENVQNESKSKPQRNGGLTLLPLLYVYFMSHVIN